jgi:hypothetical protein
MSESIKKIYVNNRLLLNILVKFIIYQCFISIYFLSQFNKLSIFLISILVNLINLVYFLSLCYLILSMMLSMCLSKCLEEEIRALFD